MTDERECSLQDVTDQPAAGSRRERQSGTTSGPRQRHRARHSAATMRPSPNRYVHAAIRLSGARAVGTASSTQSASSDRHLSISPYRRTLFGLEGAQGRRLSRPQETLDVVDRSLEDLWRPSVSALHPSLRKLSPFSGVWYASVLIGWAMLAVAVFTVATSSLTSAGPQLAMTAVLLLVLELRPLVQGRGHDPQGVVMSTAFVCARLPM